MATTVSVELDMSARRQWLSTRSININRRLLPLLLLYVLIFPIFATQLRSASELSLATTTMKTKCADASDCETCTLRSEDTGFLLTSIEPCVWIQDVRSAASPIGHCMTAGKVESFEKVEAKKMDDKSLQPNDPVYDFKIQKPEMCANPMVCSVKTDCLACANTGCVWIEWDHPTRPEHLPLCISKSHFLGASFRRFPRAGKMLFWQKHQKLTCPDNRNSRKEQLFMHSLTSLEFEPLLEMSDRSLFEFQQFCLMYMRGALDREERLPFWSHLFNRLLVVLNKRRSNGSFQFGSIASFAFDNGPMADLLVDSMLEPEAEEFYSLWMLEYHGRWSTRIRAAMHIEDETERLHKVQRLLELAQMGMRTAEQFGVDLTTTNPLLTILHSLNENLAARDSRMSRVMIPFATRVINEWEYVSGKGNMHLRFQRTFLSSSLMISDSVELPPDEAIVKLLIEHGAKPSFITPQGNSAIETAYETRAKFPESIDRIMEYLFSVDSEALCSVYFALLYSKNNDVNRLETCVNQKPTLLDAIVVADDGTDHLDRNSAPASLLQAAIDSDQSQITKYLISAAKTHDKPLVWGPKPFAGPIANSNLQLVQVMVDLGCKDAIGSKGVGETVIDAMMAFARSPAEKFADALAILQLLSTGMDVTAVTQGHMISPIDILIHILSNALSTPMFDEKLAFYYQYSPKMEPFYRAVRPLHSDAANLRPTLLSYAEIEFALRGRRKPLPSLSEKMNLYHLTFDESGSADSETDSRVNLANMLWMLLHQVYELHDQDDSERNREHSQQLTRFVVKMASTIDSALIRSVSLSLSSQNVPPTPYGIHSLFKLESIQQFMDELMSLSPEQIAAGAAVEAVRNYFWNDLRSKLGSELDLIFAAENLEGVFFELKSYVQVSALPNQEVILLLNRFSHELDKKFTGAATVIKAISDGSGLKYYINGKFKIMNSETWKIESHAEKTLEKFVDGLTVSMGMSEWSKKKSAITERYVRYVSSVFKGNNQYHIKLREAVLLQYAIKFNQEHGVDPATVQDRSVKQMLSKTSAEQLFIVTAIDAFCALSTQSGLAPDSCANLAQAELSVFNYLSLVSGTCHRAELTNVLIRAVVSSLTTVDLNNHRPVGKNGFNGFAVIGGFLLNLFDNELRMKETFDAMETVVSRKGKARAARPDQEPSSAVGSQDESIPKASTALSALRIQDEMTDESIQQSVRSSADKGSARYDKFCKSTISTLNQFIPSIVLSADQADFTYDEMSKLNFDPTKLIHNMIEGFARRFNVDFAFAEQPETFLERVSYQLSATILDKSYWQKPDLLFTYFTFKSADPKNDKLLEVFKRWVRAVTRLSDESPNDIRYKDEQNIKGFQFESIHARTSESILRIWQDEDHKIPEMTDDPLSLFLIGEYSDGSCQRISSGREYNVGLMGYVVNGNTKLIALDQDPETKIFKGRAAIRLLHYKSGLMNQDEPILVLESPYKGMYKGKDMSSEELQRKLLNRAKLIQAAFLKQDINMRLIFKTEDYGKAVRVNMCDRTESIPADSTIEMIQGLAPFVYSDFARAQSSTPDFVYPLPQPTAFCLVTKDTNEFLPDE